MAAFRSIINKGGQLLLIAAIISLVHGCAPVPTVSVPPTPTIFLSPTPTFTPTHTPTELPSPSPTRGPLTLVFYGDSVLKVGDVNQAPSEGFSFVDDVRPAFTSTDQIIVSNHGGMKARWGYDNLQGNVLRFDPSLVTLWWGMNDLGGCPGVFDRETNSLVQYKLTAYISEHTYYLRLQIDAMLAENIPVFVMTPIPVLVALPWSHFTADGQLVWETDHSCDYNSALEQLVRAQKALVMDYSNTSKPVYLVDAWQVYKDNPNAGKMYMDAVHPASHGAALIAAEWLRVFQSIDIR